VSAERRVLRSGLTREFAPELSVEDMAAAAAAWDLVEANLSCIIHAHEFVLLDTPTFDDTCRSEMNKYPGSAEENVRLSERDFTIDTLSSINLLFSCHKHKGDVELSTIA
jgi:hypothetical protein